jgi:hypothetical protein
MHDTLATKPAQRHYNSDMTGQSPAYDDRYLAGILLFNARDFFDAHEVWEGLWMTCAGPERRFYQGLIQAAVALYHFGYGNLRGALKLYQSSRRYMEAYGEVFLGLDIPAFWRAMERCFAEALAAPAPDVQLRPPEDRIPLLTLDPTPAQWPDVAEFANPDD